MIKTLILSAISLISVFFSGNDALLSTTNNLITNASVEQVDKSVSGKGPIEWQSLSWGDNEADFDHMKSGQDGKRSLRIKMDDHKSGDAKWQFRPVRIVPNAKYVFSDYYKSSVITYTVAAVTDNLGATSYLELGENPKSGDWKRSEFSFVASPSAESVTIYHVIRSNGYLQTDNFSLMPSIEFSPVVNDYVPNSSAEEITDSSPLAWQGDVWGETKAEFSLLDEGHTGEHSLKTDVKEYKNGDAKWHYQPQLIDSGKKYVFSDFYKSDVTSYIVAAFKLSDGTTQYMDLKDTPASTSWNQFSVEFTAPSEAETLTIYHSLKSIGYVVTDDYSVKKADVAGFNEGLVTITFDDGWKTAYQNGFPLLEKYDIPSTMYMVSSFINTPDHMTAEETSLMKNAGHEIASHSFSHSDLATLPPDKLETELSISKEDLTKQFGQINNFSAPYGSFKSDSKDYFKKHYRSQRSVEMGYNSKNDFDIYNIKVQNVYINTSPAQVQAWLDEAKRDKTWFVLIYHQVDNYGGQYSVLPQNFETNLANIKSSGLKTVTLNDGLNQVLPQL